MYEIELKLAIADDEITKLLTHPVISSYARTVPDKRRVISVYYDAADYRLRKNGYALRVRQIDGHFIQTVKGESEHLGDIKKREEWECIINSDQPELKKLPEGKLGGEILNLLGSEPLLPCFVTDFVRTAWELYLPDGTLLELALDQGEVRTESASEPISEIELELKKGDYQQINSIAAVLRKTITLQLEERSKAERGYKLCGIILTNIAD
jgi:inorganic triphosphatase YgiF